MKERESYYDDLRDYLQWVEENGLLVRVSREINKDTELMSLIRWQFRGLPEEKRKAFWFDNVTDAKGRKGISSRNGDAIAGHCTDEHHAFHTKVQHT